jgi:hypothetical protein
MPEFKSVTYTAQETAQNDAGKMIGDAALISGKIQNLQCHVLTPSGTAGADTILLGYLPAGAVVLPGASSTCVTAAAGAGTVSIGVAGTPAAIAAGISVAVAGTFIQTSIVPFYENTERQAVIATLSAAVTAAKDIYFNIAYVFAE